MNSPTIAPDGRAVPASTPRAWLVLVVACGCLSLAGAAAGGREHRASSEPTPLPPIVFVSRQPVHDLHGHVDGGAIPGIGPRDRTARVGGRLLVREPNGVLRVLVDGSTLFDVADPCVSWDGSHVVFAGLLHADSSWRIFEINGDGSGLRQVTRSDRAIPLDSFGAAASRFERYDDIDPCWLPDGRILFASTRYPTVAELGGYLATNLFVVSREGSHPQRVTTERNGGEEPAIDPLTGRVVYARWWLNLDRPSNATPNGLTYLDAQALASDVGNIWQILSITPDGRGPVLHAGDARTRIGMSAYKPALQADGRVLTVFPANGSLAPAPGLTGIRRFDPGASVGQPLIGLTPEAATAMDSVVLARPPALATDPVALPDGRILFSHAPTASDYGLYVCNQDGTGIVKVIDLPGTLELDGAVLAASPRPPVIAELVRPGATDLPPTEDPSTFLSGGSFRFDCLNIYANAPVDAPVADAPPVVPGARFRLFLNFQRQNPWSRDPSILFRESPVVANGAIYEQGIPAEVPFFGQIVDPEGRVVVGPAGTPAHVAGFGAGRQAGWAQCVGCHMGHSTMKIPGNYSDAEWFNVSTSARVDASSEWAERSNPPVGPAVRAIDRRALSGGVAAAWVSETQRDEWIQLRWSFPIEVGHFILHGIPPDPEEGTDAAVEECLITLLLKGIEVAQVKTGAIRPHGTTVSVPRAIIDAARIDIVRARGHVRGGARAGIAEIETIARLVTIASHP